MLKHGPNTAFGGNARERAWDPTLIRRISRINAAKCNLHLAQRHPTTGLAGRSRLA